MTSGWERRWCSPSGGPRARCRTRAGLGDVKDRLVAWAHPDDGLSGPRRLRPGAARALRARRPARDPGRVRSPRARQRARRAAGAADRPRDRGLARPAAGRQGGARVLVGRRRREGHPRRAHRHGDLAARHRRLGPAVARPGAQGPSRGGRDVHGRQRGLPDALWRPDREVLRRRLGGRVRLPRAADHEHLPPGRRGARVLADPAGAARSGAPAHQPRRQRRHRGRRRALPRPGPRARHRGSLHARRALPRRDARRRARAARPPGRRHAPQRRRRRVALGPVLAALRADFGAKVPGG